jgi:hypothetical protein
MHTVKVRCEIEDHGDRYVVFFYLSDGTVLFKEYRKDSLVDMNELKTLFHISEEEISLQ